jgi:hypothetical protein
MKKKYKPSAASTDVINTFLKNNITAAAAANVMSASTAANNCVFFCVFL